MSRKFIWIIAGILLIASQACTLSVETIFQHRELLSSTFTPPTTNTTSIPTATFTPVPPTPTFTPSVPSATLTPNLSPTQTATNTVIVTTSPLQIEVFEELWKIIDEEYLYEDHNGLDWDAVYIEYRNRLDRGMSESDFHKTMQEMIDLLGDEHSTYFTPHEAHKEDSALSGSLNYVGIGILTLPLPEENSLFILSVIPDSPAAKAGLKPRDMILAVDGEEILEGTSEKSDLLRGEAGTTLVVTVQSPGAEPRDVPLRRCRVQGGISVPFQIFTTPGGKRIGYIFLVTFNDNTVDEQVGEALRLMTADSTLDGLIIDLRMNQGGASNVTRNTLSYFTKGVVGYYVNRKQEEPFTVNGRDISGSQEIPLVVLVGKHTVSFGEIFAGILHDLGRAYLIGETTQGNVEILYIYRFPDGSRAWIAHDTFRPLNNSQQDWELSGIIPDFNVTSDWNMANLDDEPAIKAALEYFEQN